MCISTVMPAVFYKTSFSNQSYLVPQHLVAREAHDHDASAQRPRRPPATARTSRARQNKWQCSGTPIRLPTRRRLSGTPQDQLETIDLELRRRRQTPIMTTPFSSPMKERGIRIEGRNVSRRLRIPTLATPDEVQDHCRMLAEQATRNPTGNDQEQLAEEGMDVKQAKKIG